MAIEVFTRLGQGFDKVLNWLFILPWYLQLVLFLLLVFGIYYIYKVVVVNR